MARLRGRLALTLFGLTVGLLLAEAGLRVVMQLRPDHLTALEDSRAPLRTPGRWADLGDLLCPVPDPGRLYALRPNSACRFMDVDVITDAWGHRVIQSTPPTPSTNAVGVDLLGLGDSVIFGWGVPAGDAFLEIAAQHLRARRPDRAWRTMNTGVPGYNTAMQAATLRHLLAQGVRPHVIVVTWVQNDLDLPNFLRTPVDPWTCRRVFVWELLRGRFSTHVLSQAPGSRDQPNRFEFNPDRVPPAYRHMVGWDNWERHVGNIADAAGDIGAKVVLLAEHSLPPRVREACTKAGIAAVDHDDAWKAWCAQRGIPNPVTARRLSATDNHPSIAAHAVMGRTLADWIDTNLPPSQIRTPE